VRPLHPSISRNNLAAEEILRSNRIGEFHVVPALERHAVQVGASLGGQGTAGVVLKGITQQSSPIVLHQLGRCLRTGYGQRQRIGPLLLAAGSDVMVPTSDGLGLTPYTGADRDSLTINGELSKLAWNIIIGHGIHAGIHFRSSSYYSILLGEQVGMSVLEDRAASYAERFSINITKFDGTTVTVSNQ